MHETCLGRPADCFDLRDGACAVVIMTYSRDFDLDGFNNLLASMTGLHP